MRLFFQALLSLLYLGSYHHAAKKIWTKVTHTCYSKRNFTLPLTYQRSAKFSINFQTMTSNRSAPQFLRPLSGTMELTEGDELVLDVTVHGKPTPEVEWILNGSEIKNANTYSNQGNHQLKIPRVSAQHTGSFCL